MVPLSILNSFHAQFFRNWYTELASKGTRRPRRGRFKLVIYMCLLTLETLVKVELCTALVFVPTHLPPSRTPHWPYFLKNMVNVTWAPGLNTSCRQSIFPQELRCLDHGILHGDRVSILNSRDSSYHDWLYRSIWSRFSPGVPITPHCGIYGRAGYTDQPRFWLDNCTKLNLALFTAEKASRL